MRSRRQRLARFFGRYRTDITIWAATAAIVTAGAIASVLTLVPWFAIGATVLAGTARLGVEIGRRERVAGLREELSVRARDAVAAAAERHVLRHIIWRDEEASRKAWADVMMRNTVKLLPAWIETWTIEQLVERGEDRLDLRERSRGDWLSIGSEMQTAHDDFAAAVGPYTVDLDEGRRRYVTACLMGLAASRESAEQAFHILYGPESATDAQVEATKHTLFTDLRFVYTAARKLGAGDSY